MPISRDFIYSHWLSKFHHMEWNLRVPRFKTQTPFGWVSFSAYMTANTIDNDPLLWTTYRCPVNSQNKGTGALRWVSSKPGCTKTTLHFCQQRQFATRQISTWILKDIERYFDETHVRICWIFLFNFSFQVYCLMVRAGIVVPAAHLASQLQLPPEHTCAPIHSQQLLPLSTYEYTWPCLLRCTLHDCGGYKNDSKSHH